MIKHKSIFKQHIKIKHKKKLETRGETKIIVFEKFKLNVFDRTFLIKEKTLRKRKSFKIISNPF